MFVRRLFVLLTLGLARAQDGNDALRDMQIGMQGLMEAQKDPAMLAQLMQDLQVRFVQGTKFISQSIEP